MGQLVLLWSTSYRVVLQGFLSSESGVLQGDPLGPLVFPLLLNILIYLRQKVLYIMTFNSVHKSSPADKACILSVSAKHAELWSSDFLVESFHNAHLSVKVVEGSAQTSPSQDQQI